MHQFDPSRVVTGNETDLRLQVSGRGDPTRLKAWAKAIRDSRWANPVIRAPFLTARRLGIKIPRELYQHLIFRGRFNVSCPGGGTFSMISRGHQIENNVYWEGILGYEPEAMLPWIHLASQSDVVLDIGANTGIYSLLAASTSARPDVHAFEPVARIATLLRENCEINSSLRITVHQMAVGSYDGVAEIHDPGGDNCYSASLTATFLPGQKVRYPIQLGKVDTAVERLGLPKVDLVKLDVEGAEEDALDGMSVTLKRSRPAIMLELLFPARQRLVERIQRLMDNGYCLYQMEKDGLRVCNEVIASPRVRNVLLAAQDMSMGPLLL